MSSRDAIESVAAFLARPLAERGLSLWDIEFVKEGPGWFFRLYIDREGGGVMLEDCEAISRAAEAFLDGADPIEQPYTLEVCSPGLDRQLKKDSDFIRFIGHGVDVRLFKAKYGRKKFRGTLTAYGGGTASVSDGAGEYSFERAEISSCRLTVDI